LVGCLDQQLDGEPGVEAEIVGAPGHPVDMEPGDAGRASG